MSGDEFILKYEMATISASESGLDPGVYLVHENGDVELMPKDQWELARRAAGATDAAGNVVDPLDVFEVLADEVLPDEDESASDD